MKQVKLTLFLVSILSVSVIVSCSDDPPEISQSDSSPNIVLIIADDLGWDVFGDYPGANGTKANTPTIDSLAQNGITFMNFWSNPICAPTRAAMLTGKYGFRTGVGGAQTPQMATLSNSETIIQKYISENASSEYSSAVIGKWHVSSSSQLNAPELLGVDYYSGILRGSTTDYFNWTQTSSGVQKNITTYTTTHFADQSINWIKQQSNPFFLWLAFNAPHTPFHRPPLDLISDQSLSANQAEIDANPFPYYLASIEAMDKEIARLIASFTQEQKENTVFIFLGDNGTPPQVAQAPYAENGTKNTLFEGGVNVPLIFCGKNISRRNEIETALGQSPDMFATVADLAGAGSADYQDGVSLKPLLTNPNAIKRTFAYSEQFGNTSALNDGYSIRNEINKLVQLENDTEYFYDLSTDPFEENNLLLQSLSTEAQQNLDDLRLIKEGL